MCRIEPPFSSRLICRSLSPPGSITHAPGNLPPGVCASGPHIVGGGDRVETSMMTARRPWEACRRSGSASSTGFEAAKGRDWELLGWKEKTRINVPLRLGRFQVWRRGIYADGVREGDGADAKSRRASTESSHGEPLVVHRPGSRPSVPVATSSVVERHAWSCRPSFAAWPLSGSAT